MPGTRRMLVILATLSLSLSLSLTGALAIGAGPPLAVAPAALPAVAPDPAPHVVVISIDGLKAGSIRRSRTPALVRLRRNGAATLNARTAYEKTLTLPNHTGMVTGRRINRSSGGHGVSWNDDRANPPTVQSAAGHSVGSLFSVLEQQNKSAAFFSSKEKLRLFDRSWDAGIDRFTLRQDNHELMTLAKRDLVNRTRALTFIHLSGPDVAGHNHGFSSSQYNQAVRVADAQVGRVLKALDRRPELKAKVNVVVTSDHGGTGSNHGDPRQPVNFTVPFLVWGASVPGRADLYEINAHLADPGTARPGYSAIQPVRNAMVANLALDLLGLPAVKGSEFNPGQDLKVG